MGTTVCSCRRAGIPIADQAAAGKTTGITRTALVLLCSAALAGAQALPASAAETLTTVTVSQGSLGFTSAPVSATLGPVEPGTTAAITHYGIRVSDSRAGVSGWNVSVVVTDFTGDSTGALLSAAGATYTPTAATTSGTVAVAATTATDPTTPKIVQTATGVSGNNTATWNADLTLAVPNDAVVDTYTATVTYSIS